MTFRLPLQIPRAVFTFKQPLSLERLSKNGQPNIKTQEDIKKYIKTSLQGQSLIYPKFNTSIRPYSRMKSGNKNRRSPRTKNVCKSESSRTPLEVLQYLEKFCFTNMNPGVQNWYSNEENNIQPRKLSFADSQKITGYCSLDNKKYDNVAPQPQKGYPGFNTSIRPYSRMKSRNKSRREGRMKNTSKRETLSKPLEVLQQDYLRKYNNRINPQNIYKTFCTVDSAIAKSVAKKDLIDSTVNSLPKQAKIPNVDKTYIHTHIEKPQTLKKSPFSQLKSLNNLTNIDVGHNINTKVATKVHRTAKRIVCSRNSRRRELLKTVPAETLKNKIPEQTSVNIKQSTKLVTKRDKPSRCVYSRNGRKRELLKIAPNLNHVLKSTEPSYLKNPERYVYSPNISKIDLLKATSIDLIQMKHLEPDKLNSANMSRQKNVSKNSSKKNSTLTSAHNVEKLIMKHQQMLKILKKKLSSVMQKANYSTIRKMDIDTSDLERNRDMMRKKFGCAEGIEEQELHWKETAQPDECKFCDKDDITTLPDLKPLKKRYDDTKMAYNHKCPPPCSTVKRMDDILGYPKNVPKKLQKIPIVDDCIPCNPRFGDNRAPKLKVPKKKYDDTKMAYSHKVPITPCTYKPKRIDEVVGYKVVPKKLKQFPTIKDCYPCNPSFSTTAPKLKPLKKIYDDTKLAYPHKCPPRCPPEAERLDDVHGYEVHKKKLAKLRISGECIPCDPIMNLNTRDVTVKRPRKRYDDSKMLYQHKCYVDFCTLHSSRADDRLGYTVGLRTLPKLPTIHDCTPCYSDCKRDTESGLKPLKKRYDDTKMLYNHKCPERGACALYPKRSDDLLGYKVTKKKLTKLPTIKDCYPCCEDLRLEPSDLIPLKKRYDDTKLPYNHRCPVACSETAKRMDDIMGFKAVPKKLKKIPIFDDCIPCDPTYPAHTTAPELKKPKLREGYVHSFQRKVFYDTCNVDPPRMDDVLCWRPKKKRLPPYSDTSKKYLDTPAAESTNL